MEDVSAVSLLQEIVGSALAACATDVHLHATATEVTIQFRRDGYVTDHMRIQQAGDMLLRSLKVLARMDITDARLPQDGAFAYEANEQACDIRVATMPTVDGEAAVLRLLSVARRGPSFQELGMTQIQIEQIVSLLNHAHGMILVAGPTGSGKTTTLYTMMRFLAERGKRVVSIEDPVEARLTDCRQMEVRETIGLTFDVGLKSLLRHDPDVMMIGEIRDDETARVAIRAAMTGRAILSTTHAKDVVGAAARLHEFGLARPLLAEVLTAVLIQYRQVDETFPSVPGVRTGTQYPTVTFALECVTPATAALLASDLPWSEVRSRLQLRTDETGRKRNRDVG